MLAMVSGSCPSLIIPAQRLGCGAGAHGDMMTIMSNPSLRRRREAPLDLFDVEWDEHPPWRSSGLARLWRAIRAENLPAQAVLIVGAPSTLPTGKVNDPAPGVRLLRNTCRRRPRSSTVAYDPLQPPSVHRTSRETCSAAILP
jgi:hypothetical protein